MDRASGGLNMPPWIRKEQDINGRENVENWQGLDC